MMWFNLQGISGYLLKSSDLNWTACKADTPEVFIEGNLNAGTSYEYFPKTGKQLFRLIRSYLSFDARALKGHRIRSLYLSFKPSALGGLATGTLVVTLMGTTPWGTELEVGDWDKCNGAEATVDISGLEVDTEARVLLDTDGLDVTGLLQLRIAAQDEDTRPTTNNVVTFYGVDSGEVTLVANTGNILDDIPVTLAEDVLGPYASQLGITTNEISSELLPTVTNPPAIHIGFESESITDRERVTPVIYYIYKQIPSGSGAIVYSRDRIIRQKADLIKRILMADRNCGGLMERLESISITPILPPEKAYEGDWWVGAEVRPTYIRPMSVTDDVHVVAAT